VVASAIAAICYCTWAIDIKILATTKENRKQRQSTCSYAAWQHHCHGASGNQPVPVQLGSIIVMAQCGAGAVGRSDRLVASTTAVLATAN